MKTKRDCLFWHKKNNERSTKIFICLLQNYTVHLLKYIKLNNKNNIRHRSHTHTSSLSSAMSENLIISFILWVCEVYFGIYCS